MSLWTLFVFAVAVIISLTYFASVVLFLLVWIAALAAVAGILYVVMKKAPA
jgi:hypothetical protein